MSEHYILTTELSTFYFFRWYPTVFLSDKPAISSCPVRAFCHLHLQIALWFHFRLPALYSHAYVGTRPTLNRSFLFGWHMGVRMHARLGYKLGSNSESGGLWFYAEILKIPKFQKFWKSRKTQKLLHRVHSYSNVSLKFKFLQLKNKWQHLGSNPCPRALLSDWLTC